MTVRKLVELLNNAIYDRGLDPDGEILASTVNGCSPKDEESLMEFVDKTKEDGIYILTAKAEDSFGTIFYTVPKDKNEEETEE